jgi:hypothetical protein
LHSFYRLAWLFAVVSGNLRSFSRLFVGKFLDVNRPSLLFVLWEHGILKYSDIEKHLINFFRTASRLFLALPEVYTSFAKPILKVIIFNVWKNCTHHNN